MDAKTIGWIPAIAFAPLAGALLNAAIGRRLGKGFVTFVAVFTPALAFILALALFLAGLQQPATPAVQVSGEAETVREIQRALEANATFAVEVEGSDVQPVLRILGVEEGDARLRNVIEAAGDEQTLVKRAPAQVSRAYVADLGTWFSVAGFEVRWSFVLDRLALVLVLVITGIGTLIHIYSTGYMADEDAGGYARYFTYLNLFVSAMLLLVMGGNLLLMFIGWEGVGLCSYLLIGFYYRKSDFAAAGVKAFVVNRIGDFGFVLGMLTLAVIAARQFGAPTLDMGTLNSYAPALATHEAALLGVACLLLFVGATGKSAQIPLHIWLPDAMAGPTPVSALIHAATMVTAGIYMITRLSPLFVEAEVVGVPVLGIVAMIGVLTAFFAGAAALGQDDIKKVLAYSTVSQLGYMFVGVGVAAFGGAVFHLVTHAFFKALLFLGAGAVIHATHTQDMKQMGGLRKHMPVTFATMLVGALALAGLIPFSGFFSKDLILYNVLARYQWVEGASTAWLFIYVLGTLTAAITALYSLRLVGMTFLGDYRGKGRPHEAPGAMTWPLVILAVGAVAAGLLGVPEIWVGGWQLLPEFVESVVARGPLEPLTMADFETLHHIERNGLIVGVLAAVVGVGLGLLIWRRDPAEVPWEFPAGALRRVKDVLARAWLYDEVVNKRGLQPAVKYLSFGLWRYVDDATIDRGLVDGAGRVSVEASNLVRSLQTGQVARYAGYFTIGALAVPALIVFANPLYQGLRSLFGL